MPSLCQHCRLHFNSLHFDPLTQIKKTKLYFIFYSSPYPAKLNVLVQGLYTVVAKNFKCPPQPRLPILGWWTRHLLPIAWNPVHLCEVFRCFHHHHEEALCHFFIYSHISYSSLVTLSANTANIIKDFLWLKIIKEQLLFILLATVFSLVRLCYTLSFC